jgi:ABC-type dipeptide/oligopeptide/nickel transport system permease subunit
MPKYSHRRLFVKALVASVALNVLMIAAGISGGAEGRTTLLTRLSDVVASLPGIIVTRLLWPEPT